MSDEIQILLIEDDQDDVDLFQYALQTNAVACELNVIMQGDEIAPYLATSPSQPDIIVMDLNLPLVHGRDVLKQIKATDHFRQVPVLVLTTSSANEDRDYCYAMGANEFITKPTTLAGFNSLMSAIVHLTGTGSR
ncbi:Response regulator rcp1 [Fibrisoma limi BUZ 3]|uniref:Response regulator rcp1 n=1 Tax=Fibrisoma limi BUZ 3 TaxID=1185876 RepID=I2GJN6_9BACT|nr:response regulator [Fibrisoma limi]CCH54111.1 Response regulator rcp1 [Fibrisoma limi BUZ 3]